MNQRLMSRSVGLASAMFFPALSVAAQGPPPPQAGAYSFVLDLAGTPVGEIPTGIKQLQGIMEVVIKDGAPMLKASARSEFLITLPRVLPPAFTLEFDLVPKACCNPQDLSFEGTSTINQGGSSAHVLWDSDGSLQIIGGGPTYDAPMPEDFRTTLPGVLTNVVVTVEGPTIKLYTNGRRLYTLDRQFARGRVLRVFLGGQDDRLQAVYLARLAVIGGVNPPKTIAATPPPGQPVPPPTPAPAPAPAPLPPPPPSGTGLTAYNPSNPLPIVPTGGTAQNTFAVNSAPVGPTGFSAWSMASGDGYGIVLSWLEVPNATGYRVYRGTPASGQMTGFSSQAISVLDVSAIAGSAGSRVVLDAMVYPNTAYGYWVEALFADGTVSPPSIVATVTASGGYSSLGAAWAHNLRATVSATSSVQVTSLQMGTPLSMRGGSATMPGSNVTWTWSPASGVFGYEIEWSVVENGVTLVFGRERVIPDWSALPNGAMSLAPVIKGIPAGKTVRFCLAFFGDPDPTKPLIQGSGPCVTSTVPAAAATTGTIVQGGPINPRGTVTVLGNGPPPGLLLVQGVGARADLTWAAPPGGPFTYTVLRAPAGTTNWTTLTSSPITATKLGDALPDATKTYTYQVRATAANGTFGTAMADYTPPAAADPGSFTAAQVGAGEVEFRWTPVPGVSNYLISGPGLGTGGINVTGTADLTGRFKKLSTIPVGTHTWRIASMYVPGGVLTPPATWPSATATVVPLSGTYRVTLLGFEANRATLNDDITDGQGDEVYLSAFVASAHRVTGSLGAQGVVKSLVYGDVAGRSGRMMAGTLTPQGGIKTGDAFPLSGGGSWPVVNPQSDRLPLLLWQGTLAIGADVLLIQPALWESDGNTPSGSSPTFSEWSAGVSGSVPALFQNAAVVADVNANGLRWIPGPVLQLGLNTTTDHPIGIRDLSSLINIRPYTQPLVVLTREKVESVLSSPQMTGGLAPGIITVPVVDTYSDSFHGYYTVYLRVERLP